MNRFFTIRSLMLGVLLAVASSGPSAAQRFRVPVYVSDGLNQQRLVIGVEAGASDGVDAGLDVLTPPPPPPGAFDARLWIGTNDLMVDVRDNSLAPKAYEVRYTAETGRGPIVISWSKELVESLGTFQIVDDPDTPSFSFDMATSNQFDVSTESGVDARLYIVVTPDPDANAPPSLQGDHGLTAPGGAVSIDVFSNDDGDPDGDELAMLLYRRPFFGTAQAAASGTFTYEAPAEFTGTDSFEYLVYDGHGNTAEARVTIIVNAPPAANDDAVTTNEDTPAAVDVAVNDVDTDGEIDAATVTVTSAAAHGSTAVHPTTGVITYTPNVDFHGSDSFRYVVADNHGVTSVEATVSVTIQPVNDAPVAGDDVAATNGGAAVSIDVLANDTDVDLDALSIQIAAAPQNGTTALQGADTPLDQTDDRVLYTPGAGFSGTDTFTYRAVDGDGATDEATVTVTVAPLADLSVALTADKTEVRVANPIRYTATITNHGPTAASGVVATLEVGAGLLGLTAEPSQGACTIVGATATCEIGTLAPAGEAAVVLHGTAGDEVEQIGIDAAAAAAADDPDPSDDTASIVTAVKADPDGILDTVEDAAPNDGDGNGDGIPDSEQDHVASLPSAVDSRYVTLEVPANLTLRSVAATETAGTPAAPTEATFPVGLLGFTVEGLPAGAATTVTIFLEDGPAVDTYWKYAPELGNPDLHWYPFLYDGSTGAEFVNGRIVLHLVDGGRGDGDLQANGTIDDPGAPGILANRSPAAADDQAATDEDEAVVIDVLENDSDPDGDALTLQITTPPANGAATIDDGGTPGEPGDDVIRYTPASNYHGPDSLVYRVEDGEGGSGEAAVQITVTPVNDPPSPVSIVSPADGEHVELSGDPGASVSVTWEAGVDVDDTTVTYVWQLALTADFTSVLLEVETDTQTIYETTKGALGTALTERGVSTGSTVDLYHRVTTSDGDATSVGETATMSVLRGVLTSTEDPNGLPERFVLEQNYPNPFNPATKIRFSLPEPAHVTLVVYDVLGREMARLLDARRPAGFHEVTFHARDLPTGMYLYAIQAGEHAETRRMMLLR